MESKPLYKIKLPLIVVLLLTVMGCQNQETVKTAAPKQLQYEIINYYKVLGSDTATLPHRYRITYYFDDGLLHRWMELDSSRQLLTDYIAQYDEKWVQTGAVYVELEPGEPFDGKYERERVRFSGDTLKTTEWLDSAGNVYYSMVEDLNPQGKPLRAAFIGDQLHGYDTAYYTKEGFEQRIFFTNIRGKVFNDRSFQYLSLNDNGDWVQRLKIMDDTVREVQKRALFYHGEVPGSSKLFLEGVISRADQDQNSLSFSADEKVLFYTQGKDWENQLPYISQKVKGLFTAAQRIGLMDTVYNGAISPSGNRIIYCKRLADKTEIYLINKVNGEWNTPLNLSQNSGMQGGYFNWFSEEEIYFYTPDGNGDLVSAKLIQNQLTELQPLTELNTDATEFSPFIDREKQFLIFTRYQEGDEAQQGFFISYNQGNVDNPKWAPAKKIESLPYGWGAFISANGQTFHYTDGSNIFALPLSALDITIGE